MVIVTRSPTVFSPPTVACWWDSGDATPRLYSVPGADDDAALALQEIAGVTSQTQWEAYAERLATRTPRNENWETADLTSAMSPQQYLELARRRASRAA